MGESVRVQEARLESWIDQAGWRGAEPGRRSRGVNGGVVDGGVMPDVGVVLMS